MNRNTKDTHLGDEAELYPKERTLSLLSRCPEKFEKPLAITLHKTMSHNFFLMNKSSLLMMGQIMFSINTHKYFNLLGLLSFKPLQLYS